jgi:hypothetical protein
MREDILVLTRKDRDRLKVLHEVRKGHITQRQGAEQLKLTDRWIREMVARIREHGDQAVIHGLRGHPSARKLDAKVEQRAVRLIQREYSDFGPTLALEHLQRDHGITVSRETLRQWMMRAEIWKRRKQRIEAVHVWRRRKSSFGELVQWDTSEHDWLEGRGPKMYLIAMLDDATSRGLARFAAHDSTAENMRLLWSWVERHGRFLDAYTDRAGLFETNRPNQRDEERDGKLAETQIGRALRELGIGWIAARSPQAKGRIERYFQTAQDRLIKGMRKRKVATLEAANAYLENEYLPLWAERFTVSPASEVDAHRPLCQQHDLASILSHVEQRVIGADYTIRHERQLFQIKREHIRPGLKGKRIRMERRLDGTVAARGPDGVLEITVCEGGERPAAIATKPPVPKVLKPSSHGRTTSWMNGFNLHSGPSLEEVVEHAYGERSDDFQEGSW